MAKNLQIDTDKLLRLMAIRRESIQSMSQKIPMSYEGYRLITVGGTTKESTLLKIAELLGVHKSEILKNPLQYHKSNFNASSDERELIVLRDLVDKHEIEIKELNKKYTYLLEYLLNNLPNFKAPPA